MQPLRQTDTLARLAACLHTRLCAMQRAAAKVRREAARPPVVEEGRRSSSAQPVAVPLSQRLPACSPATSSLAGILTPAAASARPDALAARAATTLGTEQLASEGKRSGEAQLKEQHGGANNANSQSTAAEAEEELSTELQADIQVRKSITPSSKHGKLACCAAAVGSSSHRSSSGSVAGSSGPLVYKAKRIISASGCHWGLHVQEASLRTTRQCVQGELDMLTVSLNHTHAVLLAAETAMTSLHLKSCRILVCHTVPTMLLSY